MPIRKSDAPRGVLQTPVSDGQAFSHARYLPPPSLAPYLEHCWSVSWNLPADAPSRVETLPHPTVHLIFESGVGGRIGGVSKAKFTTVLEGQGRIFAAKFRPGGFYPFVQRPVSFCSGKILSVGQVWDARAGPIEKTMLAADSEDDRMRLMEHFLLSLDPAPDPVAAETGAMAETIATDRGLRTVEDLCQRFGINPRALQRNFARYIGVNPKWVIQRYRLHEAAEQLVRQPASQAALAVELGYADQAHFVRDFKAIVGISPGAYARRTAQ